LPTGARARAAGTSKLPDKRRPCALDRLWIAEKRTAVNSDPRIVPGILGVAEPITVPTW
jgi:hypothetical protein